MEVGSGQIGHAAEDRGRIAAAGSLRLVSSPSRPRAPGLRWRADARRRRMLAAADVIAGVAAAAIVLSGDPSWIWALAPLPLWVVVAKLVGLYDRDHKVIRHLTVDELPNILAWAGLVAAITALAPTAPIPTGTLALFAAVARAARRPAQGPGALHLASHDAAGALPGRRRRSARRGPDPEARAVRRHAPGPRRGRRPWPRSRARSSATAIACASSSQTPTGSSSRAPRSPPS